jgi:hypothetical protein
MAVTRMGVTRTALSALGLSAYNSFGFLLKALPIGSDALL